MVDSYLLLTELEQFEADNFDPDERPVWYEIVYLKPDTSTTQKGKLIEYGTLESTKHSDLAMLNSEGYSHFGIFRLTDRSTTTIVQSDEKRLHKVFSFSRSDVKVSHETLIQPYE